jgi:predicted DNA-binding transcriptional regulator AlpA
MQISKDKTAEAATPGRKLISKPQVLQLIGDPAYSTVWEWMRAGTFPLPIELGPPGGRSSMIAWYADEVDEWIAARPRRKFKPPPKAEAEPQQREAAFSVTDRCDR